MNMESKLSAIKGYIDCEISILNSKVDQFIESLKETITKIEKLDSISNSIKILQENIRFLQKELLAKNDLIKPLMETRSAAFEAITNLNPIQDWLFRGYSRMGGGGKKDPLHKIRHTYPTMMKLGRVIPQPKEIQKIHESRDTPLEFCWHQYFFIGNQQILLYQEIQK